MDGRRRTAWSVVASAWILNMIRIGLPWVSRLKVSSGNSTKLPSPGVIHGMPLLLPSTCPTFTDCACTAEPINTPKHSTEHARNTLLDNCFISLSFNVTIPPRIICARGNIIATQLQVATSSRTDSCMERYAADIPPCGGGLSGESGVAVSPENICREN